MSEELEVLRIVTERLDAAGIPDMVTGSMALNYYAVPRMTRDVDLVVELSQGDADRVGDLFGGQFSRRCRVSFEELSLFVVAPEDLVISKLDWARDSRSEVQLADARNVLRSVSGLDLAYLDRWTAHLGLGDLYCEVSQCRLLSTSR